VKGHPLSSDHAGATLAIAGVGLTAAALMAGATRRPLYSFRNRSVVITGGARGFGFALARRLAKERARLVLLSRTPTDLERARLRLQAMGADVATFECDVRDEAAVAAVVRQITQLRGGVDVLINNAGVIQMTPFEHATIEDFDESLRTHFWGPLFLIRACLPYLRRSRGRILNVASVGGRVSVPHLIPYCVGKFANVALSEGLRAELARDGILVTTASPGLMRTGSHRNVVVRGRHRQEARLFAAMSATSLTSMNADRAARQTLDAVRRGRAEVSPGWQSRLLQVASRLAPELMATMMAVATRFLPNPSRAGDADVRRVSRDLDLGMLTSIFPSRAAAALNQPVARGEARA
jgi:NAD(P)-dependent dehydrogenase (short-subunit alcohol dehydrogenase family)